MTDALAAATRSFFQPRIFRLVWMPLLGALMLWIVLGAFFWSGLVAWLHRLINFSHAAHWLGFDVSGVISSWVVTMAMMLLLLPMTHATSLFITAIFAMPLMTSEVGSRDFPQLAKAGNVSFFNSLWNAVWSTLVYLLLWIVTLPLWLFGLPAFVLPLLINGWYNDRLFRHDALAEHATSDEYESLTRRLRGRWFGLGILAALLEMVPILNLISPVYSGLTFIHFGFAALERKRVTSPPAEITHG